LNYKSITNSTYIEEGMDALRLAKELESINELREKIDINKSSKSARDKCWSHITNRYIYDENKNINDTLVKLIDFQDVEVNRFLMYYHYSHEELIFKKTIIDLIFPRLLNEGEFIINRDNVNHFISQYLDYADSTINKTSRSIVKALVDFGLASEEKRKVKIQFSQPPLISFIYALYSEYAAGFDMAKRFNILNPSVEHIKEKSEFYKLFLMQPHMIDDYLQKAWKEGYLGYEPRGGLNQYVLKHKSLENLVTNIIKK
jgi:hypothetical protein